MAPKTHVQAVIALPSLPALIEPEEDQWPGLWRGAVAEFFATLIFVFVGTGAVVACQAELGDSHIHVPSQTLIAFAHGFAIMVLVFAVGEVSGGHINPAVTWACLFTGKISVLRAVVYIGSQLFGAIVGSSFLRSILPPDQRYGMGCHSINPLFTPGQGFGAEVVFTFIFIFVVFATAISPFAGKFTPLRGDESGKSYGPGKLTPFAVGATILILHLVGIPFTGASMNPARTFGPALVNGCWDNMWVYWLGPLIGSTAAAAVAQAIFLSTPRDIFKLNKTVDMKEFHDPKVEVLPTVVEKQPRSEVVSTTPATPGSGGISKRTVRVQAPGGFSAQHQSFAPTLSKSAEARMEQRNTAPPAPEMHKSSSGQFSAIMEEDSSVVDLDEIN